MKKMDYRQFQENYIVDFERNEVHYREPMDAVRVYAHNEVQIRRNGHRDPNWCRQLKEFTGLISMMPSEFVNRRFFSPLGEPVPKSAIKNQRLIYDPDRGVAYAQKGWGQALVFIGDNLGVSSEMVSVVTIQKGLKKAKIEAYRECLDLGETLKSLKNEDKDALYWRNRNGLSYHARQVLETGKVPVDLTANKTQEFCYSIAVNRKKFEQWAEEHTNKAHKYEYLIVKEKGYGNCSNKQAVGC